MSISDYIDALIQIKHRLENAYYDKGIDDAEESTKIDYVEGQLLLLQNIERINKSGIPTFVEKRVIEIINNN